MNARGEGTKRRKTLLHLRSTGQIILGRNFFKLPSSNADTAGREGLSYCVETCSSGGVDHSMSSVDVTPPPRLLHPGTAPLLPRGRPKRARQGVAALNVAARAERGGPR